MRRPWRGSYRRDDLISRSKPIENHQKAIKKASKTIENHVKSHENVMNTTLGARHRHERLPAGCHLGTLRRALRVALRDAEPARRAADPQHPDYQGLGA